MAQGNEYPSIKELLPHRGRMLLVEEIVQLDTEKAISRATVGSHWPLFNGTNVSALMVIELVAQTSGLSNGLDRLMIEGPGTETKGWLVGIKNAKFTVDSLFPGDVVETQTHNSFTFEGFREIDGFCKVAGRMVGEVTLQVMRAEEDCHNG